MPIQRKLAAIMFTDIVGFTALSAKDESRALKLLDTQKQILTPIIEQFNGTLHKEMGDGLLLTFPSVTEAVNCGIKIQDQTKNNDNLNLRIGIHEGEVTFKDGDVLGDDVNVASRIEPFSAVGGVAISGKIQQNISSLTEFKTKYIGTPKLKGVIQEVKVYCITSHGLPQTDLSTVSAKLEKKSHLTKYALIGGASILVGVLFFVFQGNQEETVPSIAIIPLENKGDDKDEFYSYSISADLISDVSGAGDIRVASLKDIEKLDYKSLTNDEIAKKLLVRYVSQGTLWKVDSIFQLSMELYDTKKKKVEWSKNWQQNWSELPSIKGGLSENILSNLQVTTKQDITKPESENAEAYALYLQAKSIYEKRENTDDTEIAQKLLQKAIELDENLITAKLILGSSYKDMGDYDEAMEIYTAALKKAEKLDDMLWIGRSTRNLGHIYSAKGDYDTALDYYEKALTIAEEIGDKSGIGACLNSSGGIYAINRDYDKALDYYERALTIAEESGDKRKVYFSLDGIGFLYSRKGEYDTALDYYERALSIKEEIGVKSGIGWSLNSIGWVHYTKGDLDKALDYYERALTIAEKLGNKRGIAQTLHSIGGLHRNKDDLDKALDCHKRSLTIREEIGDKRGMGFSLYVIGIEHHDRGDYDKALDYFKRSLIIREELGDKRKNNLYSIGIVYYDKDNYDKAQEYLKKFLAIQKEIGLKKLELETTTYLYLSYKHLSKDYDVNEIHVLIKETENIEFALNYQLFKLLEDVSYLETAYMQIQEKVDNLEPDIASKFFSYPMPKAIIEEYNKVIKK